MYNEFNTYSQPSYRAQGATEIAMRVRNQEKQINLMNAIYRSQSGTNTEQPQKRSLNIFKSLLGIFLAAF
jgi:hypothetical protein